MSGGSRHSVTIGQRRHGDGDARPWTTYASAAAILTLGALFRFVGSGYDHYRAVMFGEQMIGFAAAGLTLPHDLWQYLDTFFSPLNPYLLDLDINYPIYGSFYFFLLKIVAWDNSIRDPQFYLQAARALAASFSFVSIFLVFFIARSVGGYICAAASAFLWTFAPVSLQQAHSALPHAALTLVGLTLLYSCLGILREGSLRDFILCGVTLALCLSLDPRGALFGSVFLLAVIGYCVAALQRPKALQIARTEVLTAVGVALIYSAFALLSLIAVFRLIEPYAFIATDLLQLNPTFVSAWKQAYHHPPYLLYGADELLPSTQLRQMLTFLFDWQLTPLVAIFSLLGFLSWLRRKPAECLLITIWVFIPIGHSISLGLFDPELLAPITPALLIFAGGGVAFLLEKTSTRLPAKFAAYSSKTLVSLMLGSSLLWSFAFARIYKQESPRYQASYWIAENVPADAIVLTEQGDVRLPAALENRQTGPFRYTEFPALAPESLEKSEVLQASLRAAEYIVIASNRALWRATQEPEVFPLTIRFYELLFRGQLGFSLQAAFEGYPTIGTTSIRTDGAHPAFTFRERPFVLIWKKQRRMPLDAFARLLPYPTLEANTALGTRTTYNDLLALLHPLMVERKPTAGK